MRIKEFKSVLVITALIVIGGLLQLSGILDLEVILILAREHADSSWFIIILILHGKVFVQEIAMSPVVIFSFGTLRHLLLVLE